jgi:hypothetical protein
VGQLAPRLCYIHLLRLISDSYVKENTDNISIDIQTIYGLIMELNPSYVAEEINPGSDIEDMTADSGRVFSVVKREDEASCGALMATGDRDDISVRQHSDPSPIKFSKQVKKETADVLCTIGCHVILIWRGRQLWCSNWPVPPHDLREYNGHVYLWSK